MADKKNSSSSETFLATLKKRYKNVKDWGQGLANMYKSKDTDSRPMNKQLNDMLDPKKSKFAEFVADKFKKDKK